MLSTLPLRTTFDPVLHGFHFSNSDIEWELHEGGKIGKNLCGGMVYAVKDNFFYGRTIPSTTTPPPRRTPLNDYLFDRQESAHWKTVPRFVFGLSWFVDSLASEYDKIRKEIAVSSPLPLFLVKEGTMKGHHVLVIGCQSSPSIGNPILEVYDPNYEDGITSIHAEYNTKKFTLIGPKGEREILKGFFVDKGYKAKRPSW